MKRYLRLSLPILFLFISTRNVAQTTGSFDTTISFMSGTRALSIYVPTGYSPANKYRLMICLHGLGDTCSNYRNGLINSLSWANNIPNTIFVCPEAATTSSDFYSPAGGEAIIAQSIGFAMARYHIDTANVVLQGFSLGGRAALRYGLDNYATFKGLLLNTPAVQGVKEALNGHPAAYSFTYTNAPRIPVYITHGGADVTYASSIDSTYEQLVLADGIVRLFDIPGLGHNIPPFAQMSDFLQFFNTPAHPGKDVEAVHFYPEPFLSCNPLPVTARLLFRNAGRDTITSVKFSYTLGSTTQRGTWTGMILPFQHATVPAYFSSPVDGDNTVSIQVDTLNGTIKDTVLGNNIQTATLHYSSGTALPSLSEGFEGSTFPPPGWVLQEAGDFYSAWDVDNTTAKTGSQSAGTFNTILIFDNAARAEGLITPLVTVPANKPLLSFDVGYNYHRYTPPYFTANVDFADTLEVLLTTDCGAHYSRIFKKGGTQLATFSTPIINSLSIQTDFATPADSNWLTENIDLSSVLNGGNATNVRFKFNYISALGGSINIDNVRVGSATGVSPIAKGSIYRIYPNPAMDYLMVDGAQGTEATLLNALGQKRLVQVMATNAEQISLQNVPPGVYVLCLKNADGKNQSVRIVKQ